MLSQLDTIRAPYTPSDTVFPNYPFFFLIVSLLYSRYHYFSQISFFFLWNLHLNYNFKTLKFFLIFLFFLWSRCFPYCLLISSMFSSFISLSQYFFHGFILFLILLLFFSLPHSLYYFSYGLDISFMVSLFPLCFLNLCRGLNISLMVSFFFSYHCYFSHYL